MSPPPFGGVADLVKGMVEMVKAGIAVGGVEVGIVIEGVVVGMAEEGVVVGMTLEEVMLGITVGWGGRGDDSGG